MEGIIHERIKPNGGIHIPKSVLAELGLKVGGGDRTQGSG